MEEVKKFNRILFVVVLIKVLGGLLTHSYSMITSSVLDLLLIIVSKVAMIKAEDTKFRRFITFIIGFIFVLSAIVMVIFSIKYNLGKISAWILLFALITMLVKYMISCYYTNVSYRRKNGVLSYGNINSTLDFVVVAIFAVTMILSKLSKWVGFFKYADIFGTILIACYILYKGILIIIHSVKTKKVEFNNEIIEKYKIEILARKEVKKVEKLSLVNYGGLNYFKCGIVLSEGISMIDANTFVITLQDYLLKVADVVKIHLIDPSIKPKHVKVRSLKEDARNSRSRNSKTNSKKKNTTKKNKKR